jgi:hypothetical protein
MWFHFVGEGALALPLTSFGMWFHFVGDGVLDVPQPNKNIAKWNAEGGVPY